jgi:hypothetical protein
MGAGASVEGFAGLTEEQKEALKVRYDALVAEGKTEVVTKRCLSTSFTLNFP